MADYKRMYLKMLEASEEALNIIIKAQRECEDIYVSGENELRPVLLNDSGNSEDCE